jgi:predicted permease
MLTRCLAAILRIGLLAYPSAFRRRRGDELTAVVAERLSAERRERGRWAAISYGFAAALDLARAGWRVRRRSSEHVRRLGGDELVFHGLADSRHPRSPRRLAPNGVAHNGGIMDQLAQDLRLGIRALRARPLLTAIAALSLALGIGANTAVFSLIDAVMLRSLPVEEPERLVVLLEQRDVGRFAHNFAHPDFADYRDRSRLVAVAAYSPIDVSLGAGGASERAEGLHVSGNYFDVLGVGAAVGRTFSPAEGSERGAHPVAVLGHSYWRSRFAGDPDIAGRAVTINGAPFTVIGVSAARFAGTRPGFDPDFYLPLSMYYETSEARFRVFELLDNRAASWLYMVGRLAPGTSIEQADAELDAIAASLAEQYPNSNQTRLDMALMPGARGHYGVLDDLETPLAAIMVVAALLLLIACANIANLLLARAASRGREIAVRLALGAGRARLVRQLLTESLLLAAIGGGAGVLLAHYGSRFLLRYLQAISSRALQLEVGVDGRILGFTALLALATALLFGLAPALRASRAQLTGALKDAGGRGPAAGAGHGRGLAPAALQNGLVVAQVALSFALLVGAGLLVHSIVELRGIDPGFDPAGALVMSTDAGLAGRSAEEAMRLYDAVDERVEALPGVELASFARAVPVDRGGSRGSVFLPERGDATDDEIDQNMVDEDYFQALGIPILAGRGFTDADAAGAPSVAVVNQSFAETFWSGESPLGKRIGLDGPDAPLTEVVGIAADGRYRSLREEQQPYVYLPLRQAFRSDLHLVVRTSLPPETLIATVRDAVAGIDRDLPLFNVKTLADKLAEDYFDTRITAWLLGLCSAAGLLLAGFGLYGVLAFSVARRRGEIGVRMALGARHGNVVGLVLRQGMVLVAIGLVAGVALATVTSRIVGSLLYGVGAMDPATLAAIAAFFAVVGALACYLPARRAVRVDPVVALRGE